MSCRRIGLKRKSNILDRKRTDLAWHTKTPRLRGVSSLTRDRTPTMVGKPPKNPLLDYLSTKKEGFGWVGGWERGGSLWEVRGYCSNFIMINREISRNHYQPEVPL